MSKVQIREISPRKVNQTLNPKKNKRRAVKRLKGFKSKLKKTIDCHEIFIRSWEIYIMYT